MKLWSKAIVSCAVGLVVVAGFVPFAMAYHVTVYNPLIRDVRVSLHFILPTKTQAADIPSMGQHTFDTGARCPKSLKGLVYFGPYEHEDIEETCLRIGALDCPVSCRSSDWKIGTKDVWNGYYWTYSYYFYEVYPMEEQYGYNPDARVFIGTGGSWCMAKSEVLEVDCQTFMGPYGRDQLVMKWNEEWERGNAEQWAYGPYDDARISIEWNGKRAGGSGEVWHFEVGWAPSCGDNYTRGQHGRYCMEDQFEVRMNPGVDPYSGPGQYLFRKVSPGGSGFYWAIP